MRGLLAQLEERQSRDRREPAVLVSDSEGYMAWAVVPDSGSHSGASFRTNRECCIAWIGLKNYEGHESVYDGSEPVPYAVAKAFGKEKRFATIEALLKKIETLCSEVAFDRLVSLCSSRERSAHDLTDRLRSEGYPVDIAREATERAVKCGVVSDQRFAESYISSKIRSGWGRVRIERGLSESGVDPYDCLSGYPDSYFDTENEAERARELLARRPLPAKNPVEKFARFLTGRGFELSTALRLAREEVDARMADKLI